MQAPTPPASTLTERTPPTKRTLLATIKDRAMRMRDPQSGGAHGVGGRYNAWRSGAPGPHAHGNVGRQVVDDWRAEVHGQQNRQMTPATTSTTSIRHLLGTANAQTAPATTSIALAHQPLGSANAETTPAGAPVAAADRVQRPDAACEGKNG